MKIILSGGGTGGHIYPAVSVAEAIQRRFGDKAEILFIGAENKMEMTKVPALGYEIKGLPVAGLQRRMTLSNLKLPFKVAKSLARARTIIKEFKPDVVVGFGGYASAPVLWVAQRMGIPTIIQEQNSYAGVTNKILAKKAKRICVAYPNMERFFSADKIVMTGNPLRGNFAGMEHKRDEAYAYFGLSKEKPVVLITGGSLGTRTLNNTVLRELPALQSDHTIQIIWQTGSFYKSELDDMMSVVGDVPGLWRGAFIERMDLAYAIADVVIARAGACTVSELSLLGKVTIFVPSPNVAEDHQTKNALALSTRNAALLVPDTEAVDRAITEACALLADRERWTAMRDNIQSMGISDSADRIVSEIERFL